MAPRTPLLVAAILALLLVPAAAAKAPAGDGFYTPPSPLPGRSHGDLIWSRSQTSSSNTAIAGAARNLLVLYRSTGVRGGAVADSGALAIPRGKAPKGGWPVIDWAHGTTGLADQCAPTRSPRMTDTYHLDLNSQLAAYVKAGYAVVQPDYEGLGTPGVHPYLIGVSEGRSVLDLIRAARQIDRHIGKSVGIIGHSQGGHAALWAASLAPKYTPELKLRGTVAVSPASHLEDQSNLLQVLTSPTPLSALIGSIFRGADVAYPQLGIPSLLSDKAAALYPSIDDHCLGQLYGADSWGGIAPSEILKPGVDRTPLLAAAGRNDPEHLTIRSPLLVLQGAADQTVIPIFTDQLVNALRANGAKVGYVKYPGVDHSPAMAAGRKDARAFFKKKLGR